MWHCQQQDIGPGVCQFTIGTDRGAMTYRQAIDGWKMNSHFADYFSTLLSNSPFAAFRWELPGIHLGNLDGAFEFVLVDYPRLNRPSRPSAFAEYFDMNSEVVRFSNLSGDTELVVPCPVDRECNYSHFASFLRTATKQ